MPAMNAAVMSDTRSHAPGHPQDAVATAFLGRRLQLFINGKWADARSGKTLDVINPATGRVIATAAAGDAEDIDLAVKAARRAFQSGPWPALSHAERAKLMHRLADAIEQNADELALLETLDGGNPITMTRAIDIGMSAESLRYNAGWTNKLSGETPLAAGQSRSFSYTLREPVGVVGAITPWNAPFLMAVNKIAPALAVGCTVVLKPAELTPVTAIRLAQLIEAVGFPPGVVNVVTGFGHTAGQALVDHADVNKISFTGSTRVGKSILAAAAGNLKRVTLELGGKSPVVIFPDADVDAAAHATAHTIFFKTGQFCAAGTRLFVHERVFDRVMSEMADCAHKVRVGPGIAATTEMGPIISQKQLDRVMGYIDAGVSAGAEIVTGGKRIAREGYFVEPTLITKTRRDMSIVRDEIFGPVLCVTSFSDLDDIERIAQMANDTDYGLAARIWTRDIGLAHGLARHINAGSVSVNSLGLDGALPFGGYKQSGLGREGGREGVEAYTEIKSVSISY
jgi:phenylacetaldehyde dehydrogenase